MITQKSKLKQLFCKHSYVKARKQELFAVLSGERIYTVCEKCGKIKGSIFYEYEGNGYK